MPDEEPFLRRDYRVPEPLPPPELRRSSLLCLIILGAVLVEAVLLVLSE
jgi:hypothetical protein